MLWNTSTLGEYRLEATDGAIGAIRDCLFDDTDWTVRWLVVDTGTWLPGRKVLLAPAQVRVTEDRVFRLNISKEQVRASPPLDSDAPVSRRYEQSLVEHYGWPAYWVGMPYAAAEPPPMPREPVEIPEPETGDPHLRSTAETTGYYIAAEDGDIGHIDDFLLDPDHWIIRYIVVDTRNWWPGKRVLILPRALTGVSWGDRTAQVDLTRDQIKHAPEYDPMQTVDRAYEERYLGYHGYPTYW